MTTITREEALTTTLTEFKIESDGYRVEFDYRHAHEDGSWAGWYWSMHKGGECLDSAGGQDNLLECLDEAFAMHAWRVNDERLVASTQVAS